MESLKSNMTQEDYKKYVDKKSKNSPIFKNIILAFIIGGLICIIGQIITNILVYYGIDKKIANTIGTISLIFLGALLTSLKLYAKIGKYAGAGSVIPITGFSNSIVAPAIEYKTEGLILGIGSNMFKIAGPVLVYGILTSFLIGILYYLKTIIL